MNKQLLSIMSLVALAVTQTSIRLVAAPPDGPGSTADSDRKFLSNLEKKQAAQSAPAESAAEPQVVPAPVHPAPPAAPAAQSHPRTTRSQTATNGNSTAVAPDRDAAAPRPAKSATRSVAAAPRTEATQTRTTATAPVRREVAEAHTQSSDVDANDGPGVSAKIYRARPVDDATPTIPRSTTQRTRNTAVEEEGTHIVQPAEIAQYGVEPTVPTKTAKVTTTYVQEPTTAVRREDRNEGRDEHHVNDRSFFHRLFHGGLFNKHGDD